MDLLIDLGNTRTKWALANTDAELTNEWHTSGYASEESQLFSTWLTLPTPQRVFGCAVGSTTLQAAISQWCLANWQLTVLWLKPAATAMGLHSNYEASQLGSDRWATLLGAWHAHRGTGLLVVSAGTACVIDAVSRSGIFLGGRILPGYRLQHLALHQHTARLPLIEGDFRIFPHSTADAIASGCLGALLDSITGMHDELARHDQASPCIILTGGDAALLADKLNKPIVLMDNLALHGLAALRATGEGVFLP